MKNNLTRFIALLAYWLGIDRLFYWLNRRCKRVLTFHNVFPDSLDMEDNGGGMSMSVSEFCKTIDEISRYYKFSVDFEDVETATITFDDGFLNQYEVAAKTLGARGIKAVLFVAGDNIDRSDVMTAPAVDLLTVWLAHVPVEALDDFCKRFGGLKTAASVSRIAFWIDVLRPMYVKDFKNRGRSVVAGCDAVFPFSRLLKTLPAEYVKLRFFGINQQQLNELHDRGWIIGWHSKSHYPLSAIHGAEKEIEFAAPEELRRVPMSYPYGELQSVGNEDICMCRQAGFPAAYSNLPELNSQLGCFFRLRFSVPSDRIMLHFHLSGLRHFLKFGRLLPCYDR